VKTLARWVATLGPVGSAPLAPATAASAVVTLVGWFLPVPPLALTGVLLVLGVAVAVWSATEAEKVLGHDAKPIVIDEVIGQSLALLWVPHRPLAFFAAFVLFRIFDVSKPLGAREIQRLPAGWGILADDVIAGLTACGVFHLARLGLARAGLDLPI
jgi:phosphatidylglycerophosphatase A